MSRTAIGMAAVVFGLLVAVPALAQAPLVSQPNMCGNLGPAADVSGSLGHKGLVVVLLDANREDSPNDVRTIPGIRTWTNACGQFDVRIAVPASQPCGAINYKIRVFELRNANDRSAETVLACHAPVCTAALRMTPAAN